MVKLAQANIHEMEQQGVDGGEIYDSQLKLASTGCERKVCDRQ